MTRRPRRDHSHRRWQRDPLPSPDSFHPRRRWHRRHYGLWLPWVVILALGAGVYGMWGPQASYTAPAGAIVGHALITDGDTIKINGQRIRLHGIDAPETSQRCTDAAGAKWRCGVAATRALTDKIDGRTVSCSGRERERDRYGRVIGTCETGGESLNAWMVRQGWAVAYTRYSYRYAGDELIARAGGRGIWAGSFTMPEEWRRQQRR